MKNLTLFVLFLCSASSYLMGQTLTGTFTQTPCNSDGIYSVSTTGIPLPITYTYYVNGTVIVHANVNSTSDQLTNIAMTTNNYIYCEASAAGGIYAYDQDAYTPSFNFYASGTSPVCPVTMGTVSATQQGGTSGPFSFVWTNTQTGTTYNGNNLSVPVGPYSAEITDQTSGCVLQIGDTSVNIVQLSDITATFNTTNANCTNGTATVVPSGGVAPYTYLWANGATSASISGLSMGYYPVVITDAQGCQSNYLGAEIMQTPQISVNTTVTNATCLQTNGSAMAFGSGGVNPYTYSWSNGQTGNNATNLSGGNAYTVVATDANGCIGTGNAYIMMNTPINVTYTSSPSQCVAATGSATLAATGGTLPYTYSWNLNPSTTNSISNVGPGNYGFEITDAVGCIRTGYATVNPISTINASIQGSTVTCPNTTGTVTASVSGSNPPFNYQWNTGATTGSLSGVPLGGYSCVITDALGCSVTKYGSLSSYSPVNVGVSTVPATCIYNTDGSATATASGGTAPYSYFYTGGVTTQTANNLGVASYYVTATDANGCSSSEHFWITNANTSQDCYCTISGDVYVDANTNCVHDSGEDGVQNIMIHCSGFGYAFTDANGHYSFQVPSGTYTISQQVNQYYPLSPCQNNSNTVSVVAASGCNTVVDFSNVINPLHDLKIVTMNASVPPIPGNPYQQLVVVKNEGTITESGIQLGYEQDNQIPFSTASLPSFLQQNSATEPDWYSVQSGFPTLAPNGQTTILLNYNTPTNIPLGTLLDFYDSVAHAAPIAANWLLDNSPWNNVNTFVTEVIGSYDPNYKEVTPRGEGAAGYIDLETSEFDYTIHFQNEGTYFAQNIVVTDQLDEDFDWTTFRPGYSEYEYSATMNETGLVTFTFANINLPWKSGYGDALSSALVQYSIKRKTTTPLGTEFTNSADIFFDYNAPITTNTTLNTLAELAVDDEATGMETESITMDLYPVPAYDYLTIRINNVSKNETATVSIIDLMGHVVLSDELNLSEGSTVVTKQLSGLMAGTYLTRVVFEDGSSLVRKIVLQNN